MMTKLYRNIYGHKYIEVRRYADGHYAYKAFVTYFIPEFGRNYFACGRKRAHKGTWARCRKVFLDEVLDKFYEEVDEAIYIKVNGEIVKGGDAVC